MRKRKLFYQSFVQITEKVLRFVKLEFCLIWKVFRLSSLYNFSVKIIVQDFLMYNGFATKHYTDFNGKFFCKFRYSMIIDAA